MWFCCFTFFFWPYQVACGILVPWPGIKPVPPSPGHWKHSLNLCTAREVPVASFFFRFIYFFLAALGLASWAEAFSSWGGYTLFAVYGLLTAVAFLVREHRLRVHGIQWLQRTGSVVPWQTGSSWARDQTCVLCIGRWALSHWTTGEVPCCFIWDLKSCHLPWQKNKPFLWASWYFPFSHFCLVFISFCFTLTSFIYSINWPTVKCWVLYFSNKLEIALDLEDSLFGIY